MTNDPGSIEVQYSKYRVIIWMTSVQIDVIN
jgi:hypothetical protein